ncbi:MAG: hypothetical protein H8E17_19880, partial [Deltaproteobacteria bacterium]|nr:hypothetical protein [Deltaproteobacteria bacterium]
MRVSTSYFLFVDSSNNYNSTVFATIPVLDNDPPVLFADHTYQIASTGEDLTFSIKAADNIEVTSVSVIITHDNIIFENLSLIPVNELTWELTVGIPLNATFLRYRFYYTDEVLNFNITEFRTLYVLDNDPHNFVSEKDEMMPKTGSSFEYQALFDDNFGGVFAIVNYSIDGMTRYEIVL